MKFTQPIDAPLPIPHTLLISCPNNGGLVALHEGRIEVIDYVDTIGLHASAGTIIRGYQTPHHAFLDIFDAHGVRSLTLDEPSDIHDVILHEERIYIVSTGSNEVLVYNLQGRLLERITRPGENDAWHINCIAPLAEGLCITAFGPFTRHREWAGGHCADRGLIIPLGDLTASSPVLDQLNKPHTPRRHNDDLYCCDSNNQSLVRLRRGERRTLHLGGFTRGLSFCGDTAYVGLSVSRTSDMLITTSHLAVIDLKSFTLLTTVPLPFEEIYDIASVTPAQLEAVSLHYARAPVSRFSHAFDARNYRTSPARSPQPSRNVRSLIIETDDLKARLHRQTHSLSWKLTAPLRTLKLRCSRLRTRLKS